MDKLIGWSYRWLPIIFGCHCREDRSFHCHGRTFPVCARCTGELIGILLSLICTFFFLPTIWVTMILMLPMIADGIVQMCTSYESTNLKRLITGILFGYALFALFVISTIAAFNFGLSLTTK